MSNFEQIKPGTRLKGLDPGGIAEVVSVSRFGNDAINLVFRSMEKSPSVSFIGAKKRVSSS
jgi:hypothetical protein